MFNIVQSLISCEEQSRSKLRGNRKITIFGQFRWCSAHNMGYGLWLCNQIFSCFRLSWYFVLYKVLQEVGRLRTELIIQFELYGYNEHDYSLILNGSRSI